MTKSPILFPALGNTTILFCEVRPQKSVCERLEKPSIKTSKVLKLGCGVDVSSIPIGQQAKKWAAEATIMVGSVETYYCADSSGYTGLSKKTGTSTATDLTLYTVVTGTSGSAPETQYSKGNLTCLD